MTTETARRRFERATRALQAAELAELAGPQLEAFEVQAADAYARYATIAGAQSPVTVSAR